MTTTTQAPATDISAQGASAPATVDQAKDAATVKRAPRTHKPAADKKAPAKAPTKDEVRKMSEAHDKAQAAKPAKKGASKPGKAAPSGKAALYFIAAGRPASGAMLHAHTEAFMSIYGMHKGNGAPIAIARAVMGATAVNYHKQNARFEVKDGKVFLTEAGKIHFAARVAGIDSELVSAYIAVMTTGKIAGPVKNPNAIAKIGA